MSIKVDERIINGVLDDKAFYEEARKYINQIIDEEIAKGDDMDDNLVSDCIDLLEEIENEETENRYDSKKIIRYCHKKNIAHRNTNRRIAAAIILIIVSSAVTLQVNPALAKQVKTFFEQVVQSLSDADEKTANTNINVKALYGTFKEKPKTSIKDENEINLDDMEVYALTQEGEEINIPLSDCKTERQYIETDGEKRILVVISYGGCSFSISYTLEG